MAWLDLTVDGTMRLVNMDLVAEVVDGPRTGAELQFAFDLPYGSSTRIQHKLNVEEDRGTIYRMLRASGVRVIQPAEA